MKQRMAIFKYSYPASVYLFTCAGGFAYERNSNAFYPCVVIPLE